LPTGTAAIYTVFTVTDSGNINQGFVITTYREANIRGGNLRQYFPFTCVVSHNSWKLQKYGNKTRVMFRDVTYAVSSPDPQLTEGLGMRL